MTRIWNPVKSVRFDNMSLYTLAMLYLDCFKVYPHEPYEADKKLMSDIRLYICYRGDEPAFYALVYKYSELRTW